MKYPNPSRTVTAGTTNVFNDDVVLACNTSTGAITINLGGIASGYWNTTWKLYIYDSSGNASSNNITINAGGGQTINGSASLTIGTAYAGVIIRVVSNTQFLASTTYTAGAGSGTVTSVSALTLGTSGSDLNSSVANPTTTPVITLNVPNASATTRGALTSTDWNTFNNKQNALTLTTTGSSGAATLVGSVLNIPQYSAGAGGYATIQEEGSPLTQRNTMNFIGYGVTASDDSGNSRTNINIVGGVQSLTNAALLSLISGSQVVVGQQYLVTDATINTGDIGTIVTGTRTNQVSDFGWGIFYNADYQNNGNYSGVTGYGTWLNIWWNNPSPPSVSAGDVVIYNNNHYRNQTGSWGSAPSGDGTNWQLLSRASNTGYILATDFVMYDVANNLIKYRKDYYNNEVDLYDNGSGKDTIKDFQWGRTACTYNRLIGQNLYYATNSGALMTANTLINTSFTDGTGTVEIGSYIANIFQNATVDISYNRGFVRYNYMDGSSLTISNNINLGGTFDKNIVTGNSTLTIYSIGLSVSCDKNEIHSGSTLTATAQIQSNFTQNYLSNSGTLNFAGSSAIATITGCQVSDNNSVVFGSQVTSALADYKVYKGYSNWEATLDFSTDYVGISGTLTIPVTYSYVGKFTCIGSSGLPVEYLVNAPTNHDFILQPNVTSPTPTTLEVTFTAIGSATANRLIWSTISGYTSTGNVATGRTNGCDNFIFRKYGTLIGLIIKNIWQ